MKVNIQEQFCATIFTPDNAITTETLGLIKHTKEEFDRLELKELESLSLDALMDLFTVMYKGEQINITYRDFVEKEWNDTEYELINRLYFLNALQFRRDHAIDSFDIKLSFVPTQPCK
jgi:hypothetical protein